MVDNLQVQSTFLRKWGPTERPDIVPEVFEEETSMFVNPRRIYRSGSTRINSTKHQGSVIVEEWSQAKQIKPFNQTSSVKRESESLDKQEVELAKNTLIVPCKQHIRHTRPPFYGVKKLSVAKQTNLHQT